MNLWFRLIWMLLTVRWRPRTGVLDTTTMRMTVLPNDLDLNGHVNNGRYLTLADLARIDFVIRNGAGRVALALRARPVAGDALAKFRRGLGPFQRYTIETRLLGWDEKWTFMEQRFVRHGRVLGVVVARGLLVGSEGPVPSATLAAALKIGHASPALPEWVLNWNKSCDLLSDTLRAEEATALSGRQVAPAGESPRVG